MPGAWHALLLPHQQQQHQHLLALLPPLHLRWLLPAARSRLQHLQLRLPPALLRLLLCRRGCLP